MISAILEDDISLTYFMIGDDGFYIDIRKTSETMTHYPEETESFSYFHENWKFRLPGEFLE